MNNFSQKQTQNAYNLCAVVCEYNPFHNGHLHQLSTLRSRPDVNGILCLMSGNFTQRGEAALLDKYTRARHAICGGADLVAELPLPFAIGNAETFAGGAVKLLSALPVRFLAFGCEYGSAEDFYTLAAELNDEPETFRAALKEELNKGESFARSRCRALKRVHPELDERLFSSPNCVLGLEYTRAILRQKANIQILPLPRIGSGHGCGELTKNYASASSIRRAVLSGGDTLDNLSDYVKADLSRCLSPESYKKLDAMEYFALIERDKDFLQGLPDCSEGLESALKRAICTSFSAEAVVTAVTSRRYTAARIHRILLAALLGVTKADERAFLNAPLFLKPLAVSRQNSDMVLSFLQNKGKIPLLTGKPQEGALSETDKKLIALTQKADEIYAALCGRIHMVYGTEFV